MYIAITPVGLLEFGVELDERFPCGCDRVDVVDQLLVLRGARRAGCDDLRRDVVTCAGTSASWWRPGACGT